MGRHLGDFIRDESGETVIEYVMLGTMLGVIVLSVFLRVTQS